ncbi:polymer-forming cytoskeletal protein [Uliginosibacterium sp. sgz301328]|uniref:bactofilin family protein n=1 Tax=Uliginosibacterium sp. sgz301328 TaxID=3243764 RepID=UPI00359E6BD7
MFGSKKNTTVELTKLSSLIAGSVEVCGDVNFVDGLRVDGHVRGNVSSKPGVQSLLVLSEQGSITGNVTAYDAVINGTVKGDLEIEHFLELQPNARVTGDIIYRQLRMDCGAVVDGCLCSANDSSRKEAPAGNVVELPGAASA